MKRFELRENLVWQRATAGEKEKLLDTGLADKAGYIRLGRELGEIINEQQDLILALKRENRRLEREKFNLRKTKRRKK